MKPNNVLASTTSSLCAKDLVKSEPVFVFLIAFSINDIKALGAIDLTSSIA